MKRKVVAENNFKSIYINYFFDSFWSASWANRSIYMDQVVAIFFGSILVYYINSKKTFKEIILISFILISFLQFKDSLSAFAFLVIGFIIVDQGILFYQRKTILHLNNF